MGAMGWSPAEFWDATPADLTIAYAGWRKMHGLEGRTSDMTPGELVEAYEEEIERAERG